MKEEIQFRLGDSVYFPYHGYGTIIGLHNDGLVHISKISKDYIKHPSDLLSVGDIVDCYVIAIDKDKEKVSLSLIKE